MRLIASAVAEVLFALDWDASDQEDVSGFVEDYFCSEQQDGSDGM